MRGIPDDDPPEHRRDAQTREDGLRRTLWLVCQHCEGGIPMQRLQHRDSPLVEPRVHEQALVVELEKPGERLADVEIESRGFYQTPHQERRTFADPRSEERRVG